MGEIYKDCDTPPKAQLAGDHQEGRMVSFQVVSGRIKTFQSDSSVSTGGADGWSSFGGAGSSLDSSSLQEEPALELELIFQSGAQ